jgi:hypothetical protein
MSQQPPNPFSREGSGPEDGLGASGSGSGSGGSSNPWPTSAGSGSDWPSSGGSPAAGQHGSSADEWPVAGSSANPYSAGSPSPGTPWPSYPGSTPESGGPYGGSPYPSSAGSAPNFDPQPTPPYGSTGGASQGSPYSASSYGDNPYEVNPYQPSYGSYAPYGVQATQHPQATLGMILGIVGVAACPPVGIAGLVLGNKARKEIDAEPGRYSGRGMATAGFVLGIISVGFMVMWVLFIALGASGAFD